MISRCQSIDLLIADDHPLSRKGLRQAIEERPGRWRIREASNGEEVLALCGTDEPDAVLLDISMPKLDGLAVIGQLRRSHPSVRIVVISMHDEEEVVDEALHRGALAYVLKDDAIEDCLHALDQVLADKRYVSSSLCNRLLQWPRKAQAAAPVSADFNNLTPTELKVFRLIASDLTSKEIADKLNCSIHTINAHRQNLSKKLGLSGTHSLLKFAFEWRNGAGALAAPHTPSAVALP